MKLLTNEIAMEHYLILASVLFSIGMAGILFNRRNIINLLMSIEIMLLAANINLVAFSSFFHDLTGQVMSIITLTIAAAEAAVGLAILVSLYRNKGSIEVEDINHLRG